MSENTCLEKQPLSQEMLDKMDAYWRASNYLSAGQLYLLDNPLLKKPLSMDQIKKKIVGHWGTVPGQNFVYVHCNRVIKRYDFTFRSGTRRKLHDCKHLSGRLLQ
jgi:xylulose-5-phosphate/fructose-6-phosphate phosphoketolase